MLLTALGVTLLLAIHRDPVDLVMQIAQVVHLPLSSRLFDRVLDLAFHATPKKEVGPAMTAFGYAILMGTEGVGLSLRRSWARWFTIGATSSLLPIEVFEIVCEPHGSCVSWLLCLTSWSSGTFGKGKEVFEGTRPEP